LEKKQGKTITFRIDGDIIDRLDIQAQKREITLNKFVNQILRNYLDWDMLQSQAGMIPIAKPVLLDVFCKMDQQEVINLAKRVGKNTMHDTILYMKQKIDVVSFLSWLETWLKKNSTSGFSHTKENDTDICIMKHDLGENWSLYHKTVLHEIFNESIT
jgi:HicB family